MINEIRYFVSSVSSELLFVILFICAGFQFRQMRKIKILLLGIKSNYDQHIKQSISSNKENLRSNLRKLYLEIESYIQASKKVPEPMIEEFYSAYELYRELGGNGYIKHLKEQIDEWMDEQRGIKC